MPSCSPLYHTPLERGTYLNYIENQLNKKDAFACLITIDFRKAFDYVNGDLLREKLTGRLGLSEKFRLAQKTLYKDVYCSVDTNHTLTDWFLVNSGVKQDVYSHLPCLLMIWLL